MCVNFLCLNVLPERSNCRPDIKFRLSFGEYKTLSSKIFLLLICNSIFPLPSTEKEKPPTATDIFVFVAFSNVVKKKNLYYIKKMRTSTCIKNP